MKYAIKPHKDFFSPVKGLIILIIAVLAIMSIENL